MLLYGVFQSVLDATRTHVEDTVHRKLKMLLLSYHRKEIIVVALFFNFDACLLFVVDI